MPGSKGKKPSKHTKSAPAKKAKGKPQQQKKKKAPAPRPNPRGQSPLKKSPPKKSPPKSRPPVEARETRGRDTGAGIWFRVAEGIEHAVIQKTVGDGSVVALTDSGSKVTLAADNVFHSSLEARAHGKRW